MGPEEPHKDDEIDLVELINIIWAGKLWLIVATVLATGVGGLYTVVVPTIYEVTVNATVHPDTGGVVSVDSNPGANALILEMLPQYSEFNWNINSRTMYLTLETENAQSPQIYSKDLNKATALMTSQLMESTKHELEQIAKLGPYFQGTEQVSKRVLKNQRFLYSFETKGLETVNFSTPQVRIKHPKTQSIVALSVVFGGIIGVLGILIDGIFRNRRRYSKPGL